MTLDVGDTVDPPLQPAPSPLQFSYGYADLIDGRRVAVLQVASVVGTFAYFMTEQDAQDVVENLQQVIDRLAADAAAADEKDILEL